jgi:glycerol-3-phosphate dehydrogenase
VAGQHAWAEKHRQGVDKERALQLLLRYGTRATTILDLISARGEKKLASNSEFSDTEIEYLLTQEQVCKVEDITHRRTNLAFTGEATPQLVQELTLISSRIQNSKAGSSEDYVQQKAVKAGGR